MSIVKNTNSNSDSSVRIAKLGQIPGTQFYVRKNVVFTNRCFDTSGLFGFKDDSVIIEAELPANKSGYFFGIKNSNSSYSAYAMTMEKTSNALIKWTIGTDTYTAPYSAGKHLYGIVDGKPWYDGSFISNTAHSGTLNGYYAVGGATIYNGASLSGYQCIETVTIYRAIISARRSNREDRTHQVHSYYPCYNADFGSVAIYDARAGKKASTLHDGTAISGVTSASVLDTDTTFQYGVSIDDLRIAFNSGYHDLLALVAEDSGIADENADAAEEVTITTNGVTTTRKFAFCLTGVPLPSGWTLKSRPSTDKVSYTKGDLIYGRTPKWHIWADGINIGKYTTSIDNKLYVKYNIFHEPCVASGAKNIRLEDFDGYNNNTSVNRVPTFEFNDNLTMEFNNKVLCFCNADTRTPVYGRTSSYYPNDRFIFHTSTDALCTAKVKVGNLASWSYPQSHFVGQNPNEYHTGMAMSFLCDIPAISVVGYTIASAWKMTTDTRSNGQLMPFCADSSAATKTIFRDGVVDGSDVWKVTYFGGNTPMSGQTKTLNDYIYELGDAVPVKSKICLISSATAISSLNSATLVYTDKILSNNKDLTMTITKNSGYRCLLKNDTITIGGTKYYIFPVATGDDETRITRVNTTDPSLGGFKFHFCLWSADPSQSGGTIISNSGKSMTMTLNSSYNNNGTVTKKTFSKAVSAFSGTSIFFSTETPPQFDTVFPDGSKAINDLNKCKAYLFVCEFRNSELTGLASNTANIPDTTTIEIEIS